MWVIKKEKIIQELDLKPFGGKGWMNSSLTKCPICGRNDKFGILFTDSGGVTHCFYECSENYSLYRYLKFLGRTDLISNEREFSINSKLIEPSFNNKDLDLDLKEVNLPKGFERINFDKYLFERGFKSYQYDQFQVGITNNFLEKRLHNYLIFKLFQKNKLVGWLARSRYSKEWHKENMSRHKEFGEKLVLRYRNSSGTDFSKIVGGYDEITENTHTVIVTEGLFDKANISNHLNTNSSEELKVIFTFGDSFSKEQIDLLRETNVKNIILMYDPGTVRQSKQYSMELSRWFNVEVCLIDKPDIDPGNISKKYLCQILKKRQNFLYFYNSKLDINLNFKS